MTKAHEFVDQPSDDPFRAAVEFRRNALGEWRNLGNTHEYRTALLRARAQPRREPVFISISPTTGRAYSIYKSADSGSNLVAINTALL